jgi:ribosomal-protein-alanine N-acetyltransferase
VTKFIDLSEEWSPASVAVLPATFRTARLKLRPIAMKDSRAIFDTYAQDEEVARYLTWQPHQSLEDTQAFIADCLATPTTVTRTYVVTGREDGSIRGVFDLRHPAPHHMEFGYALARRWWGMGLMTEALTEIVRWALRQENVFRIGSMCDVENIGSARVMEKAGLIREGMLRRRLIHPNISDDPRDCFIYAITR